MSTTTSTSADNQFPELTEEEYEAIIPTHTHIDSIHDIPLTPDLLTAQRLDIIPVEEEIQVLVNFAGNYQTPHKQDGDQTPHPRDGILSTKAATAIERVTGPNKILTEFDFLRVKLKCYKTKNEQPSDIQKEEYINLLDKLHDIVDVEIRRLKEDIKMFEKDYYNKHNAFPSMSIPEYKLNRKKLNNAKYLTSTWNGFKLT